MFKNYFKIAFRNILKHHTYSIINITGLAIGMACFIFIALYIRYELSYDKYHENGEQIYRIILNPENRAYQGKSGFAITPAPLAPALKIECPEIINVSRVKKSYPAMTVQHGDESFVESRVFYIDPDFLKMFTFPLLSGNPGTALNEPYSIILTKAMAVKYFGDTDPMGQVLTINQTDKYVITGVIENTPQNSHFTFEFLASFNTLYSKNGNMDSWNSNSYQTYVQLNSGASVPALEAKFDEIAQKYKGAESDTHFRLEHLYRIHLHGDRNFEIEANGDIRYIYLFAAIGFFILLIACFNYVNISTAQSARRAKEVGLRKVVGANRSQVMRQFLSESLMFSFSGFFLASIIVELFLPAFCMFIDHEIRLSFFSDIKLLFGLFGILLVIGCFAGAYPAFFISAFQPTEILKKTSNTSGKSPFKFRNLLVVIQFIISAVLIISTITVYKQLHFVRNKNLGYKKDHILSIRVLDKNLRKNYEPFFTTLSLVPQILGASASSSLPHQIRSNNESDWEGRMPDEHFSVYHLKVDSAFINLYGISQVEGQKLKVGYSASSKTDFILNRTAVKVLGWKEPIGKRFGCSDISKENGQIVGVIEDFHFYPLHYEIQPLALELVDANTKDWNAGYFSIKISSQDVPGTIAFIEESWKQHSQYPFNFEFLDSQLDRQYQTERRLGELFNFFTTIAVFIGCLGLYGLTTFSIERKIKEIGIRKVLGATITQIVNMLSREIIISIIIANVVAWPIAWFAMNKWLENFAYRTELRGWIFALAGGLALVIALLTVSWQAIRAALANPVEALRYE